MRLTAEQKKVVADDVRRLYPDLTSCKLVVVDGARITDIGEVNASGVSEVTLSVSVKIKSRDESIGVRVDYVVGGENEIKPKI